MNANEFDGFANGIRRMLKNRTRPLDLDWEFKRDSLRSFLLSG